jgi:hypothetical protein
VSVFSLFLKDGKKSGYFMVRAASRSWIPLEYALLTISFLTTLGGTVFCFTSAAIIRQLLEVLQEPG